VEVSILYNKLSGKSDRILAILEALGFENIKYNSYKDNFRFSREHDTNPSACVIDCKTLCYTMFSAGKHGNIFSLIMDKLNCSFPDALRYAAREAGISEAELNIKMRLPFGGFYRKLVPSRADELPLQTYPESTLEPYAGQYNLQFLHDGIDLKTQERFGIGYDFETGRITIPERSLSGELVGIMGRSNIVDCPHESRWLPIIPCSRTKTLYGYVDNYKRISEGGTVVLMESEKAVLQAASFGSHVVLGLCGCHVSDYQRRHILMLRPNKIILALDEGLDEEVVREEAAKLKMHNSLVDNKVGYVWDEAAVVPEGSKMNVCDLGKDAYSEGLRKYVKWV